MTPERENEIAYAVGNGLGRIMRAAIIVAGCVGLMSTCTGLGAKEIAKKEIVKPVKKKAHKQAKKKCHCDCKKTIDKPVEIVTIENIGKELNAKIILSGRN